MERDSMVPAGDDILKGALVRWADGQLGVVADLDGDGSAANIVAFRLLVLARIELAEAAAP